MEACAGGISVLLSATWRWRISTISVNLKSQCSLARSIFEALFLDIAAGRSVCVVLSLKRDLQTILRRMDSEGLRFCTVSLPTLSAAVIQSFRTGRFELPLGFAKARGTSLPRLFSGLMKEIYANDGTLLPHPSIASITEVVQICGLAYKLDVPCQDGLDEKVISEFLKTEIDLLSLEDSFDDSHPILELARTMLQDVFDGCDASNILPKHGPGSVATGEKGIKKWRFKRKYLDIHNVFPYYDYFVTNRKHLFDRLAEYKQLLVLDKGTAKVSLVPKDSRGPRLISAEPLEYQFIQQGLWGYLKTILQSHPFTRQHVNFDDQSVNQSLAMQGSIDGSWATLDMKEASDRISERLVSSLFKDNPLWKFLSAARSHSTLLPNGQVVDLRKFAPMGSAICFPVESVVHYVLAVASIMETFGVSRWEARRSVFVYGDDLIVKTKYAKTVLESFPLFGLLFNEKKCFCHGPFRESCGMDAFLGRRITPVRWRKPWPQRLDAVTSFAFSDMASLFYQRGYVRVAEVLWNMLEKQYGKLPTVPLPHSDILDIPVSTGKGYLCKVSRIPLHHTFHHHRFCKRLQTVVHRAYVSSLKLHEGTLDDWEMMLKLSLRPPRDANWGDLLFPQTMSDASKESSVFSKLKRRWISLV